VQNWSARLPFPLALRRAFGANDLGDRRRGSGVISANRHVLYGFGDGFVSLIEVRMALKRHGSLEAKTVSQ
jgi:hypothetical protein